MIWRWQRRFAEAEAGGLLRDKTGKPGKTSLGDAVTRRVVALTRGEATHWTGRTMAEALGISLRSVQRIWAAHRLQPQPLRTFKRNRDPDFLAKLEAILGLYVTPPQFAALLSINDESQYQPRLPGRDRPLSSARPHFVLRPAGLNQRLLPLAQHHDPNPLVDLV